MHIQWHHVVVQQPLHGFDGKGLHIQRRAVCKGALGPDGMDACQKATDPLQHLTVVKLRRAATTARAHAKSKPAKVVQGLPPQHQWAHRRNFIGHQLGGKVVFFLDLCIGPAFGTVELGNNRATVFELYLVDAVFIGGESDQAAIAAQAHAVQCVQHQVGGQGFKRVKGGARVAVHAPIVLCGLALAGWMA